MLGLVLYAVIIIVLIVLTIRYAFSSSEKGTSVPGLVPTTQKDGNLPDIGKAGSLHEFLMDLHHRFGPIASFWMGTRLVMSIASAELFKQHQKVFDRPPELFRLFEPMTGAKSIQYANGTDGRARRTAYDKSFSHEDLKMYYPKIQKVINDLLSKWSSLSREDQIPVGLETFRFAMKASLTCMFGDSFDNEEEIQVFKENYDLAWSEMEAHLADPVPPDPDSPRAKTFRKAIAAVRQKVQQTMQHRRTTGSKSEELLLIDRVLEHNTDPQTTEDDSLTNLVGSFHTTGNLLTWAVYFLASHEDVQEKVYQESMSVLGELEEVNFQNISQLTYLRQVTDETLRCAVIAPWAARFQDVESQLGGYKIPKDTPVIHALGVVLQDEQVWPEPTKFNPDRFAPEHRSAYRSMAFSPFGFAGKRKCPGYNFSYIESAIFLASVVRKFRIHLVEGQVVKPTFGLVTHPVDEVWVTVSKRN